MIRPKSEKTANFFNGKAQIPSVGDEAQSVHIGFGIIPIAAVAPQWRGYQPDLLIVPDHPLGDPARLGRCSDIHSVTRLSRSAFITTLTDDNAIAAAAMIGDSIMPKTG